MFVVKKRAESCESSPFQMMYVLSVPAVGKIPEDLIYLQPGPDGDDQ
jgi:hypothetical protein